MKGYVTKKVNIERKLKQYFAYILLILTYTYSDLPQGYKNLALLKIEFISKLVYLYKMLVID